MIIREEKMKYKNFYNYIKIKEIDLEDVAAVCGMTTEELENKIY